MNQAHAKKLVIEYNKQIKEEQSQQKIEIEN